MPSRTSRASPKSEILHTWFSPTRMLRAAKSRWITWKLIHVYVRFKTSLATNFLAVTLRENAWGETLRPWFQNSRSRLTGLIFLNQSQRPTSEREEKTTNTRLRDAKIARKRDFETLQNLFRDFKIGLKVSETQVFLRSHSIPLL